MIKTLNPYTATAKTAEIMSRYRPIAPKPEVPMISASENPSMSQTIRQSPYLRNLWPQMQARPTRTRKRGRAAISPPIVKRPRNLNPVTSPVQILSYQGFAPGPPQFPIPNLATLNCGIEAPAPTPSSIVTLPLLPCSPKVPVIANQVTAPELACMESAGGEKIIDLNTLADHIPEEKDLLQQLQGASTPNVITPLPVRPVGSSISVGCISEDPRAVRTVQIPKKPEEVEDEVESEALPAVISDSNNKVRMANSAYKEMVGQPECSWLDAMVTGEGSPGGGSCRRINGEVMLHFFDSKVPVSSNGFSCWVRIEWGRDGMKRSINAFCDVIRLTCQSKDYLFSWRFHTSAREASRSSTNV
ncbi:hypothetical protein CFOL_v3_00132 [Cephalotus follicularis]|uniref:DUF7950 domain-containing protein n=1 Tax=Cephalotus follicularis TaxID=3775 RepID=A0A1Q3ALR9_CEPFO|nr:hypothetical protein CFOL_v3_00132 [Cephalotus follicularis]